MRDDITVTIPALDEEHRIGRALASVLPQLRSDDRIVVVDDGSADQTFGIAEKFASKDSRITVRRNRSPIGPAAVINEVLDECDTAFLARQDADDLSLPGRIAHQRRTLTQSKRPGVAGCAYYQLDYIRDEYWAVFPSSSPAVIRRVLKERNAVNIGSALYACKALQAVGGFDEKFGATEGYRLIQNLDHSGFEVQNVPFLGYLYLIGEGQNRSQVDGSFRTRDLSMARATSSVSAAALWSIYRFLPRKVQLTLRSARSERNYVKLTQEQNAHISSYIAEVSSESSK